MTPALKCSEDHCSKSENIRWLEENIRYLRDSDVLLRDTLDLKEKRNGARDTQIKEAKERLRELDDEYIEAKEEHESLRTIVLESREKISDIQSSMLEFQEGVLDFQCKFSDAQGEFRELKGYHEGAKEHTTWTREKWVTVGGWIMAIATILLSVLLKGVV